jgi:hypothetical protein
VVSLSLDCLEGAAGQQELVARGLAGREREVFKARCVIGPIPLVVLRVSIKPTVRARTTEDEGHRFGQEDPLGTGEKVIRASVYG